MELDQIMDMDFSTLDDQPVVGRDVLRHQTLLILIDAHRTRPERSAADVAWARERLDPGIELVLIWPRRAAEQARVLQATESSRMYLDAKGNFRRLVSPMGKRVAVLADPEGGVLSLINGENPVFDLANRHRNTDERGADHMIDLGDVFR